MTNRFGFTKERIASVLLPEKGKRSVFYDSGTASVNGLVLVVTSTGRKSFQVYKKLRDKPLRVTIGQYPNTTIEMARKNARKVLADIDNGVNPNLAKKAQKVKGITLRDVFEEYLEAKKKLKPGTILDYRKVMRQTFPDWLDKPMQDISPAMVSKRHSKRGESSKARANNAVRVLRALFNFARTKYKNELNESHFPFNPVDLISENDGWYPVQRRQTKIEADQLKEWFTAVMNLGDATARDYFRLLLLTGLRREEASRLRWDNIDLKRKKITIYDTKNMEPHTLPLSNYLFDMLLYRAKEKKSHYVFPSPRDPERHIVNVYKHIKRVREKSDIYFTLHDLRRTFATLTESLDISHYTVKQLLNHKMNGDVTAGYIVFDAERLRGAMQKITDHVLRLAEVKAGGDIVKLTMYQQTIKERARNK